jgi:hypothetical protein
VKQEKKVVPDKLIKYAIESAVGGELVFADDVRDDFADYFAEHFSPDFLGKELPARKHIKGLIMKHPDLKRSLSDLVDYVAYELEHAFNCAEMEFAQFLKEEQEDQEQIQLAAKQLAARNKLVKSLTPAQKKELKEAFNITV